MLDFTQDIIQYLDFLSQADNKSLVSISLFLLTAVVLLLVLFFVHIVRYNRLKSEQQTNLSVLESSSGAYILHNTKDKSFYFSSTLLNLFNLTSEPKDYNHFLSMLFEENQNKLSTLFQDLTSGKITKDNLVLLVHSNVKEGEKNTLECSAEAITDAYGNIDSIILWFVNVSHHVKEHSKLFEEYNEVRKSLQFHRTFFNNVPFPIWRRDHELNITRSNKAYDHIVGKDQDSSVISELSDQSIHLAKLVKDSKQLHREEQHVVVDGQRRLYAVTEVPIHDKEYDIYYHLGFGRDITELEEARNQVKRYVSAQEDLLESSGCASAIFGPDTRLKFYNNSFVALWSLDQPWLDDEPTYGDFLEMLREQRKLPEQANFPKFKQDQLEWFTNLIEPHDDFIHLPDGRALRVIIIPHALGGLLISYEDITDKLEFERSYNTLIAVQRATLDHLHEGVCVLGQDGHITLNNPTYAKLWSLPENFLDSKPHISAVMDKTRDFYQYEGDWQLFKDSMIARSFKRISSLQHIERTDGSVVDVMNVPLPDGATLMAYLDVTDTALVERSLRERNDALEEADKLKTEFLANVSYELRSPLTSILGFSDVLKQEMFGPLTQKQQEYVADIFSSSKQLMSLIDDTLDLSSIDAGYMELHTHYVGVNDLLHSIPPLINERLKEKQLHLTVQCPNNIGKILADEQRIKQALFKLLSNAIKFTHEGGNIILGAKRAKKGHIAIWVEDDGIGIDKSEQENVFKKFYRTSSAEKHKKAGAGLGLSIVKSFIKLHGGDITLISEPGKGTCVTCILPKENEDLLRSMEEEETNKGARNIIYNDL